MSSDKDIKKERKDFWQKVPSVNSCSRFIAEAYYAMPISTNNAYGGWYNSSWSYHILPLNTNLSQKGNDIRMKQKWDADARHRIYVGTEITGISAEDGSKHRGRVANFTFFEDKTTVKYFWIVDEKTETVIPITAKSAKPIIRNKYTNPRFTFRDYDLINLEDIYDNAQNKIGEAVDIFSVYDDDWDDHRRWDKSTNAPAPEVFEMIKLDDAVYRKRVLKMLNLDNVTDGKCQSEKIVEYLDLVFYTDFFLINYFEFMYVNTDMFIKLLGLNSNAFDMVKTKPLLRETLKLYYDMMGEPDHPIGNFTKLSGIELWCSREDYPVKMTSYKSIYMFIKAIQNMFRKNMNNEFTAEYMDETDDYEYRPIWNRDCNSIHYMRKLRYFIFNGIKNSYLLTRGYYTGKELEGMPVGTSILDGYQHDGQYRYKGKFPNF